MQVALRSREVPKLLVCHDMAGGYHDDAWAQGCICQDPFYITHWHLVDTFVYFSHSFITIPPPGWINAAHRHDVEVRKPAVQTVLRTGFSAIHAHHPSAPHCLMQQM